MDCTSIIQDYSFFVPQMLNKRNVGFSGILFIFIPGIALNATVHFFLWIKYLQSQVTRHISTHFTSTLVIIGLIYVSISMLAMDDLI